MPWGGTRLGDKKPINRCYCFTFRAVQIFLIFAPWRRAGLGPREIFKLTHYQNSRGLPDALSEILRKALQLYLAARDGKRRGLKLGLVEPESQKLQTEIVGL